MGSLAHDLYSPTHSLPAPAAPLHVRVLEVAGAVDLLTAPALADRLANALADATPLIVVVDLRHVDFLATAGLSVLVDAHQRARMQHTTLRLVVTTHAVRRALRVTGLDQALVVYPALMPALAV